ncbi:MAG: hypothetical protein ACWA5U_05475 [bacterium]
MAGLSQVHADFSDIEDRILLRLNTTAKEEFRFWLTRRFLKRLFPVMERNFESIPEVASQNTADNRHAVMQFQRQEIAQRTDFSTPFEKKAEAYPLGKSAIVVSQAKLVPAHDGQFHLALKDEHNRGIDVTFDSEVLYLLQSLLYEALQKTDWDLLLEPIVPVVNMPQESRILN